MYVIRAVVCIGLALAASAWAGQVVFTFGGVAISGDHGDLAGRSWAESCMDLDAGWFEAWCLNGDGGTELSLRGRPISNKDGGGIGTVAFNSFQTARTFTGTNHFDSRGADDGGSANPNTGDGGVFVSGWVYYEVDAGLTTGQNARLMYVGTPVQESIEFGRITNSGCGSGNDLDIVWTPGPSDPLCQVLNGSALSAGAWHQVAAWRHYTPGLGADRWEARFWVDGVATTTLTNLVRVAGTPDSANVGIFLLGPWTAASIPWSVRMAQVGIRLYLPTDAQVLADYNRSKP